MSDSAAAYGAPAGDGLEGASGGVREDALPASDAARLTFDDLGCTAEVREAFAQASERIATGENAAQLVFGRVVTLDRTLPLVMTENGAFRAEHDVRFAKESELLPAIGDWVVLAVFDGHEHPVIVEVLARKNAFSRRNPHAPDTRQVLAANVDSVLVVHALSADNLDAHRLERELVIAWECGAEPSLVLTKADEVDDEQLARVIDMARIVAPGARIVVESAVTGQGVEEVRTLIAPGTTAVVIGRSGAGKSTLINRLLGYEALEVGSVRAADGAGRHTTVARSMHAVPGGGVIIDAPGLRTISLVDAWEGLAAAFPEIVELEGSCRFRDCRHDGEPGCSVRAAVEDGAVDVRRLESYRTIHDEMVALEKQLEERGRSREAVSQRRRKRKRR